MKNTEATELSYGWARVSLIPPSFIGLPMGGYGARNEGCTGIHDRLDARISYFSFHSKNSTKTRELVWISLDLIGISSRILDPYRSLFSKILQIPQHNLVFCFTHTHSSWESLGVLGKGPISPLLCRLPTQEIHEIFIRILRGIKEARRTARGARIGIQKFFLSKPLILNRRTDFPIVNAPLTIIRIVNAQQPEELLSVLAVFPAHCTLVNHKNLLLSGDWAAYFHEAIYKYLTGQVITELPNKQKASWFRTLEEEVGVSIFIGAQGNISPYLEHIQNGPDACADDPQFSEACIFGKHLAKEVHSRLHTIPLLEPEQITFQHKQIAIRLPLYGDIRLFNSRWNFKVIGDALYKWFLFTLIRVAHGKSYGFTNVLKGKLNTWVGVFKLGDHAFVETPGETFYELGEKISAENKKQITVLGLTNDYASYIYSTEEFRKGGYENVFQIAPQAGEYILRYTKWLLKEFKQAQ